jgi:hypothetical protein
VSSFEFEELSRRIMAGSRPMIGRRSIPESSTDSRAVAPNSEIRAILRSSRTSELLHTTSFIPSRISAARVGTSAIPIGSIRTTTKPSRSVPSIEGSSGG